MYHFNHELEIIDDITDSVILHAPSGPVPPPTFDSLLFTTHRNVGSKGNHFSSTTNFKGTRYNTDHINLCYYWLLRYFEATTLSLPSFCPSAERLLHRDSVLVKWQERLETGCVSSLPSLRKEVPPWYLLMEGCVYRSLDILYKPRFFVPVCYKPFPEKNFFT